MSQVCNLKGIADEILHNLLIFRSFARRILLFHSMSLGKKWRNSSPLRPNGLFIYQRIYTKCFRDEPPGFAHLSRFVAIVAVGRYAGYALRETRYGLRENFRVFIGIFPEWVLLCVCEFYDKIIRKNIFADFFLNNNM